MPNEELKQYIQKSRQAGKTDDQIRQELLSSGWGEGEVENILNIVKYKKLYKKMLILSIYFCLPIIIDFVFFGIMRFLESKELLPSKDQGPSIFTPIILIGFLLIYLGPLLIFLTPFAIILFICTVYFYIKYKKLLNNYAQPQDII